MKNKNIIYLSFIILAVIAVEIFLFTRNSVDAIKLTCKTIGSYEDAQRLYKTNPIKYAFLDHNHNGIACDTLLDE